jgi:O-antigen/teichoic acid export membrane protein
LLAIAFLLRQTLASWLNVPTVALSLALFILPLAFLRPVVAGLLQGQERMVVFGLTRTFNALGRFISAIILVTLIGMLGAVASFSIGATLALAAGLVFAGRSVWKAGPPLPSHYLSDGVRLAAAALVAYAAYMSLLNIDLIAVNRTFEPEVAGNYATAVLLRRVLTLVPGAVIVVMYPRAVARITQDQLPDNLLLKSATAIAIPTLVLIALYFTFGSDIVQLAFGSNYSLPNWLLGWVAVGMMGYSFGAIWMSLFLATRPLPFVLLIVAVAVSQTLLYLQFAATLQQIAGFFTLGGWALAAGGLLIYIFYLRPALVLNSASQTTKT